MPGVESRFKIFSDPVHGFISVPRGLILDLVQTPEVQRLRRIRQLGVGYLVFPGAEHTRFGHALGAMALMQDALSTISEKGTPIAPEEHTAALAAALLHDVGHGPFSHTLEHIFISDFRHEEMSRTLLLRLNERFGGALALAIRMFDGEYERPFFHQLVSSQLDMDRLDYLRRDSFYTGVVEGEVGVQRIIKTMRVHPLKGGSRSQIVVESKGIYAVENFIISRRLMYWQVYLHKTVLAGDQLLGSLFRRVRHLLEQGGGEVERVCSPALLFFLKNEVSGRDLTGEDMVAHYCELDDTDVLYSLKRWCHMGDPILSDLCRRFLNRDFFRVSFLPKEPSAGQIAEWEQCVAEWMQRIGLAGGDAEEDAGYYLAIKNLQHAAYERMDEAICIVDRAGRVQELSEVGDTSALAALTRSVVKPYVAFPKEVDLGIDKG